MIVVVKGGWTVKAEMGCRTLTIQPVFTRLSIGFAMKSDEVSHALQG